MTERQVETNVREKALIVGVEMKSGRDKWSLEASLDELTALAEAAGVEVVGRVTQRMDSPNRATCIGKGKIEEVLLTATELGAPVILFDQELSPTQQRNLEKHLELKVIDRTALILDVFARHARTREGMLQVELAQYEYRLPRLTRLWTHLARQAGGRAGGASGGVGVRGPGETQIEIDRREIRHRVTLLKGELETLRAQRKMSREGRRASGLLTISLVGYTNAGKSTLMNVVAGAEVYVADQLFATLDPTTRRIQLPSGRTVLLSDTVGFIQKLPTQLVAAFRATLEEIAEADLLLHVVDITHPDAVKQAETVEKVLDEMGLAEVPMVVAANKIDSLMTGTEIAAARAREAAEVGGAEGDAEASGHGLAGAEIELPAAVVAAVDYLKDVYPEIVAISAARGIGLGHLLQVLDGELEAQLVPIAVLMPYTEGGLLNQIHTHGIIDAETHEAGGTRVRARVPRFLKGVLARFEVGEG